MKDVAYEKIKKKILYDNVRHMSENRLVQELNMSRTPIREALFKLQHEGFLEIISNQGIMVNKMSVDRLESLIDMRVAIETFSLKKAFEMINESDFENLNKLIREQEIANKENNVYGFREKDAEFHLYLLEITDNYYFLKMFSEVHELQFTAQKKNRTKLELDKLINDHKEIVTDLEESKIDEAIKKLVTHINSGK